jgi:hypothetical protein
MLKVKISFYDNSGGESFEGTGESENEVIADVLSRLPVYLIVILVNEIKALSEQLR